MKISISTEDQNIQNILFPISKYSIENWILAFSKKRHECFILSNQRVNQLGKKTIKPKKQ